MIGVKGHLIIAQIDLLPSFELLAVPDEIDKRVVVLVCSKVEPCRPRLEGDLAVLVYDDIPAFIGTRCGSFGCVSGHGC